MSFAAIRRWLHTPLLSLRVSSWHSPTLAGLAPVAVAGAAAPLTALVYGPSLANGASSLEVVQLESLGYTVTIASDVQWAAMTTAQFAA